MTNEEKQLLLKDLCARIPYRTLVQLNPGAYNKPETCILTGVHGEQVHLNVDSDPFRIDHIKPYLRPMSSMTEEEKSEWLNGGLEVVKSVIRKRVNGTDNEPNAESDSFSIDWLNAHYFDYRGLIEKGLALEAPEGMYKIE